MIQNNSIITYKMLPDMYTVILRCVGKMCILLITTSLNLSSKIYHMQIVIKALNLNISEHI